MELNELIQIVSWSLWILAGIVIGLIASAFSGVRRMIVYNLTVGVVMAIFGGLCSTLWGGDMTKMQLIVSVLVACLFSGVGVLLLNRMARPRK